MNNVYLDVTGTQRSGSDINDPRYRKAITVAVEKGSSVPKSVYISFTGPDGNLYPLWLDPSDAVKVAEALLDMARHQNTAYPVKTLTTYTFPSGEKITTLYPPTVTTTVLR